MHTQPMEQRNFATLLSSFIVFAVILRLVKDFRKIKRNLAGIYLTKFQ